jgi:hypothetical protein
MSKNESKKDRPNPGGTILVIGDWFIDENWLMAKCDTYHSYNVGDEHYISLLNRTDCFIMSLCGAASIMRILNGKPKKNDNGEHDDEEQNGELKKVEKKPPAILKERYELIGIGAWNPKDEDLLQCILCSENKEMKFMTPYMLSSLEQPGKKEKKRICSYTREECQFPSQIINLINKRREEAEKYTSTNRLIRIYEGFGSDQPRLRYRYDWQLELTPEVKKNFSKPELEIEKLKRKDVKAIIVVDHAYGVIDETLVEELCKNFPDANWYVRSKQESPRWLNFLKNEKKPLRLVFTDEQLINYKYCTRVWQHGSSVPGRGLLELFGDMIGLKKYEDLEPIGSDQVIAENAAIYFENETAVAASIIKDDGDKNSLTDASLYILSKPQGEKMPIRVGRSSVFFASLVYWDLMANPLEESMNRACKWALRNAYEWTKDCTDAWLKEEPSELSGPFEHAIYKPILKTETPKSILTYNESWDEWNASSRGLGVVEVHTKNYTDKDKGTKSENEKCKETENPENQIQLWRAFGTLKDYICAGGRKRTKINEMVHKLYHYTKDPNPIYPFNCLFLAEPGWGKSFLAKCIADYFDFEFLSFSIAQMASNEDLIDSFKVIASTQNRTKKRVLVFMDEIDAQIEAHYAMGLLLGPIWDGAFKIEGNIYTIDPCVWVFASTKPTDKLLNDPKGRDFLSRINGPIIDLDFLPEKERSRFHQLENPDNRKELMINAAAKDINKPLRIELVYHGVNFLNKMFGPISYVNRSVLEVFYNIMPVDGIRSLSIFVSKFRNISRGHVSIKNVPKFEENSELQRHIYKLSDWPTENSEDPNDKIKVLLNPPK